MTEKLFTGTLNHNQKKKKSNSAAEIQILAIPLKKLSVHAFAILTKMSTDVILS